MIYDNRATRYFFSVMVLLSFLPTGICFAQDDAGRQYHKSIGFGLSGGRSFLIDKTVSSLTFDGFYKGISATATVENKSKQEHIFYVALKDGKFGTSSFYASEIKQTNAVLRYAYLHEWISPVAQSLFSLKAGADIVLTYNRRTYKGYLNRQKSFEYHASLGAVIKAGFAFNDHPKAWAISNMLGVRPISFLVQPAYERETSSGAIQENKNVGSFFKSGNVAGPEGLLQLSNEVMLQKPLSKVATISIAYLWSFWNIKASRELKQASHLLEIGYFIKF
jgi:hypothetical protein